jgi:hypothetical protein
MFRSRFTNFTYAGSGFPGGAARRSWTQAASLAAITVLMLGTVSGPATAQIVRDHRTHSGGAGTTLPVGDPSTPLRAFFTKLTCTQQSNDDTWPFPDHDEPYLVIFSIDLRGRAADGRIVMITGFGEVDTGDTIDDRVQFWSVNGDGTGSPIASDDDYICLAALMESDDYKASNAVDHKVYETLSLKLRAYKQAGMSRATMASFLRTDMDAAIAAAQGDDDRVGPVFEILWGTEWLPVARSGQTVTRSARLVGSDTSYNLEFQLRP